MKCPKCYALNGDHRSFCRRCGAQALFRCPCCGFANEPQDAYCGGCGKNRAEAINAAPAEVRGEGGRAVSALPHPLLADILKEEAPPDTSPKESKKAVTQEEIDELFNP